MAASDPAVPNLQAPRLICWLSKRPAPLSHRRQQACCIAEDGAHRAGPLRNDPRLAAFERWLARSTLPLTALDTETTSLDPFAARLVGISLATAPGEAATCRSPTTTPACRTSCRSTKCWRASSRGSNHQPTPRSASTSSTTSMYSPTTASHWPASRTTPCSSPTSSNRQGRRARPRPRPARLRHLGLRRFPTKRCAARAQARSASTRSASTRPPNTPPRIPITCLRLHQRLLSADRRPTRGSRASMRDRDAGARGPLPHGAQRRADRRRSAGAAEPRTRRACSNSKRAHEPPASRSTSTRRSSWPKSCSTKLGLPVKKKTPSGTPSTDEEVLSELALDYPLPKVLLESRQLAKLKGTYTDKLPKMVNAADRPRAHQLRAGGRGHRPAGVERPQPAEHPGAHRRRPAHRAAFIAPGGSIVSADYSQIELRIMAHLSEDARLLEAFAAGEDVHRATAAEIFGVTPRKSAPTSGASPRSSTSA
jgi:DNA polymerase-1